mmetsp:Transcript_7228/g.10755  ORF Transcript_7228/g.10755 Transcript_7228/m.10755 type:complete len:231 (-) Transcript_7228:86-778(-)
MSDGHGQKKGQISITTAAAFILFAGVFIIGFNYWHAMKCVQSSGLGDMDDYVKAMERRLLEVESQMVKNSLLTEKVINELQAKLATIDAIEMQKLVDHSKDEAVRIALTLAAQPAPPMSQYVVEDKYKDPEALGNLIDDLFESEAQREESQYFDPVQREEEFENIGNFENYGGVESGEEGADFPEENEVIDMCNGWKRDYSVVTGVSWGQLPNDLQKKWKSYNCDYYIGL